MLRVIQMTRALGVLGMDCVVWGAGFRICRSALAIPGIDAPSAWPNEILRVRVESG